jgi:hypothetical protein
VNAIRLRTIRESTLEEVEERIKSLEKEFGMSSEKFEELLLKQKLDPKFVKADFEWDELVDSYKGYIEDGELDYTAEETRDFRPEQTAMLTAKRLELLYRLAVLRVESINDLAQKVKRNVKTSTKT